MAAAAKVCWCEACEDGLKPYSLRIAGPLTYMRIRRQINDFFAGFNETATADREMTTPFPFRWAALVILVVVLSALAHFLVVKFK